MWKKHAQGNCLPMSLSYSIDSPGTKLEGETMKVTFQYGFIFYIPAAESSTLNNYPLYNFSLKKTCTKLLISNPSNDYKFL